MSIRNLLHSVKGPFIICLIACAFSAFFSLFNGLLISFVIDSVLNNQAVTNFVGKWIINNLYPLSYIQDNLHIIALIVLAVNLIIALFLAIRYYTQFYCGETIAFNIKNALYASIQKLDLKTNQNFNTGDLIQRCTSDIEIIKRLFQNQIQELIYSCCVASFAIAILFSINLSLTLIAIIFLPFIIIYAYFFFNKIRKVFKYSDEKEAQLTSYCQEVISGIRVVKAFDKEAYELKRFNQVNEDFKDSVFDVDKVIGSYWASSDFLCYTQIFIVLIAGIFFVNNHAITTGEFVVFLSYELMIVWPIRNIGRILSDMGKCKVSFKRINEVLNSKQEDYTSGKDVVIEGNIEFKHVSFAYEKQKVLDDISFKIDKGMKVAIIGTMASGKTTLINLLLKFFDNYQGEILLDGHNLKDINITSLRSQISCVLQEPFLYAKSIKDNININEDVSLDMIHDSARKAFVHDDILEFNDGYDTLVGEKGVTLSGGQKQRVAIARSLLKESAILIFDDSLSAVDTKTDKSIRDAISKMNINTSIIITQRINSAQDADLIIVMDKGKIVEMGKHQDLINNGQLYQTIYNIQTKMEV